MSIRIFGFVAGEDADAPVELQEVTFACSSHSLRRVAAFFEHAAALMDQHGPKFGHEHLGDFDETMREAPSVVVTGALPEPTAGTD